MSYYKYGNKRKGKINRNIEIKIFYVNYLRLKYFTVLISYYFK